MRTITTLAAAALALFAIGGAAQAAPAPVMSGTSVDSGLVTQAQYIDSYNRHRHHHGHVHGNPHGTHLDCTWHRSHEHCQVHRPRHRHYHWRHHHRHGHHDHHGHRHY